MTGHQKELDGRVAIVTGAGRNIGRAVAVALADAGAAVVVNARSNRVEAEDVARAIEASGGKALACVADVADAAAVEKMMEAAGERFGRIDILVNNAAVRREVPLEQMTLAEWQSVLGVILDGAFNCVKACLPHLKRSGAGCIVNIGGLSAHMSSAHRAHVVTAKAGLIGFTRALAMELAAHNIRVNTVTPGLMATVRTEGPPGAPSHPIYKPLVGGAGLPEDVAAMVRYLCGPGGRYITGQNMQVNGGAFFG
jgi:3-oxoacyl-[acyl-carrier protein] reductase